MPETKLAVDIHMKYRSYVLPCKR